MLNEGRISEEELSLHLQQIQNKTGQIRDLLDNLLYWAVSQMEHLQTHPIELSLINIVETELSMLREQAAIKQLKIENNISINAIIFADSEQAKIILRNILTNAVATTLGPKGRNVGIDRKFGSPTVLHDGVSVAKEIELDDPYENMGAQLVKEAASKTDEAAGDGTTTATILAHAIVSKGLQNVTAGANPMLIRKGLEKGLHALVANLESQKQEIKADDKKAIAQVATISAASSSIGEKIADAVIKVGKDGLITAEEGKGLEIETKLTTGMEFDQGFVSPYFATKTETMEAEIKNPYIIITDKKISSVQEFLPFLEKLIKLSKNFVIIAEDLD
ncbi:MAG TPA: TCP-1/cpn60 chaperonin family protein, partial [bacterium]|nr:TCP-1/cpn60 chaperonin family protein [bacterium]